MANESIKISPLGGIEGALVDEQALAVAEKERERNAVQIALECSLSNLHGRKGDIEKCFDEMKMKAAWAAVKVIIGSEIEEAVRGMMIVPEYSQKGSAKQNIFVFVGTHWMVCQIQIYYDYIKEACRRIGLSDIYVQNPDYMNDVFENVAFRVSHHITTVQPHDGVWINLRNCTVEICSGDGCSVLGDGGYSIRTHEHRAEDFFKYCLPYDYDPEATCPKWHKFLDEVLPEKESQKLLGEYIGYGFTTNLKLEKMAVFYGGGANGKSVCLDVVKMLFGRSNVSEATLSSVTNDAEVRSLLEGKLINISSESNKTLNTAILKMLVSGEPVEMRQLYVGTRLLLNPPKLITSYNELPKLEYTYGFRRRWLLFPFNRTIAENEQDPTLVNKLAFELSGILNWVLENLKELVCRVNSGSGEDFTRSDVCQEALNEYFKQGNSLSMFYEDCCTIDDAATMKLKELYMCYQDYCRVSGISKPSILKNFKSFLVDKGAKESRYASVRYMNVFVDKSVYE